MAEDKDMDSSPNLSVFGDNTDSDPDYQPYEEQNISGVKNLSVVRCLEFRLKNFEEQWRTAQSRGSKSTMKRKAKRISTLKNLIKEAKSGKHIDLKSVPDPLFSPVKKSKLSNKFNSSSDPICNLANNNELMNSNHIPEPLLPPSTSVSLNDEQSPNFSHEYNARNARARKQNFCLICKKLVKEFCKHFQNVHKHSEEGVKLNELNQITDKRERAHLKRKITDDLRKKGNAYYARLNNNVNQIVPVKRSKKPACESNTVQCNYCEGFYNRRKFSQHLGICDKYEKNSNLNKIEGTCSAIIEHSLPIVNEIPGATNELKHEVLRFMKPRQAKETALKDEGIMRYASEFHKTRRNDFQKNYVSRVITDLSKLLLRMQEKLGSQISCLDDIFNPALFRYVVEAILEEGGYDENVGSVNKCGLGNRLRSHLKGAAETAKNFWTSKEFDSNFSSTSAAGEKRKRIKYFLKMLEDKWANEVGRIFDNAAKKSRSEGDKKIAAEEDIVKTCQYITSQYRKTIKQLNEAQSGSILKQQTYNTLLDLLVTHIMCLIRRRPVDFKRGQNIHYEKLDKQEELLDELINSSQLQISKEDLEQCSRFKMFYVPGKGWKELVPITLTSLMKEAMDAIQKAKIHVGITCETLFIRAKEMPINPRESLKKVTRNLKLKKPVDLSGNGLRHHAATFSKLHSGHPQYQDYLASALGHSLHIHKLHYEMPSSIIQKLIVMPVLDGLTKPVSERGTPKVSEEYPSEVASVVQNISETVSEGENSINISTPKKRPAIVHEREKSIYITPSKKRPARVISESSSESSAESNFLESEEKPKRFLRKVWTEKEKKIIYGRFGDQILEGPCPSRKMISELFEEHKDIFVDRTLSSMTTFVHNKYNRKQKGVTPEVKKFQSNATPQKDIPVNKKPTNVAF